MAGVQTTLTDLEVEICKHVARQRQADAERAGADPHKHGLAVEGGYIFHLNGCLREMAFAKIVNRYWTGAGLHWEEDDDVGGVQVRSTAHANGHLIIRPDDEEVWDQIWALVIGMDGGREYTYVGSILDQFTRIPEFWGAKDPSRPPCWWIPQDALTPPKGGYYERRVAPR